MKKKKPILPITRPTLDSFERYLPLFKKTLQSGLLTQGVHVQAFEARAAKYLGVKHCVAVSSCTSGLMLVLKGLGLSGEVILPSFTFAATGHPLIWNGLKPVFVDIDPDTYTIDREAVERAITKKTSAILATHVFGVPCNVEALQRIAKKYKLKLIFDAAHAFSASVHGKKVGTFGDAEVFSLSPIKILTAAEGGLVATNNDALANFVRLGRNYGDDGTNNMLFAGLSARMSELHAAVALRSFASLPRNLKNRTAKAAYLTKALKGIDRRLVFQTVPKGYSTTQYIFSVRIDPSLGYTRDELHDFLAEEGIRTRKYFYPPLHTQPPYRPYAKKVTLPVTDAVTHTILALPMYSHMTKKDMDRVVHAVKAFYKKKKLYGII